MLDAVPSLRNYLTLHQYACIIATPISEDVAWYFGRHAELSTLLIHLVLDLRHCQFDLKMTLVMSAVSAPLSDGLIEPWLTAESHFEPSLCLSLSCLLIDDPHVALRCEYGRLTQIEFSCLTEASCALHLTIFRFRLDILKLIEAFVCLLSLSWWELAHIWLALVHLFDRVRTR